MMEFNDTPDCLKQAALLACYLQKQKDDSSQFIGLKGQRHLFSIFCLWKKAEMTGKKLILLPQVIWAFERLGSWYPVEEKEGFFRRGELRGTSRKAAEMIVELANSGQFDVLTAAWEWLYGGGWQEYLTEEEMI